MSLEEKDSGVWKPRLRKQPMRVEKVQDDCGTPRLTGRWRGRKIIIERTMKVTLIRPVLVAALSEL